MLELGKCTKHFVELMMSYGLNKKGLLIFVYTRFMKDNRVNVTLMMATYTQFMTSDDLEFRTFFILIRC